MSIDLTNPQWQRHLVLGDGWRIFVRPIRPDDDHSIRDLLAHVSKEDLRLRFFDSIKEFSHEFIASDRRPTFAPARRRAAAAPSVGVGDFFGAHLGVHLPASTLLAMVTYLRPASWAMSIASGRERS